MSSGTQENPNGGHWSGHYEKDGKEYPQLMALHFEGGKLTDDGKSADEIGAYTITGSYQPPAKNDTKLVWTKQYTGKHSVAYDGVLKKADTKKAGDNNAPAWQIVGSWKKSTPAEATANSNGKAAASTVETGKFVLNAPVHQDPNGGLWVGWFAYPTDQKQISVVQAMHFRAGQITCDQKAADPIGAYTITGSYTPPAKVGTAVKWVKQYKNKHSVEYEGTIQLGANKKWVIRGSWKRPDITSGPNTGPFELSSP